MSLTTYEWVEIQTAKLLGKFTLVLAAHEQRFLDAEKAGVIVRNTSFRAWAARMYGRR